MVKKTESIVTRFEPDVVEKIDAMIEKKMFDNRAQLIRRAVWLFIQQQEKTIYG